MYGITFENMSPSSTFTVVSGSKRDLAIGTLREGTKSKNS